jgi:4-azaleucine resistance transporter AzlC
VTGRSFRVGVRAGMPFAVASFVLAISFGVVAREAGFSAVATVVMSAIVYGGSAQFAAIAILSAGGGAAAAVAAGTLTNSRFLPLGIAFGPSLPGRPIKRALEGQAVVDSSWVMALRPDGRFDRHYLFGHSATQYVAWVTGTAAGALSGDLITDPHALGLDAVFPAFFVAVLFGELRDRQSTAAAAAGAAVALALISFTPPGVPVLAASAVALAGLHRRMARPA